MKVSTKALLCSIFVFPGIGHLILKRYKSSVILITLASIATTVIVVEVFSIAWRITQQLTQGGLIPDMWTIRQHIHQQLSGTEATFINWMFVLLGLVWLVSIIDVYRLGREDSSHG